MKIEHLGNPELNRVTAEYNVNLMQLLFAGVTNGLPKIVQDPRRVQSTVALHVYLFVLAFATSLQAYLYIGHTHMHICLLTHACAQSHR